MILHTVTKSPFSHYALRDCLQLISPNDALLLLEDGVYACKPDTNVTVHLKQLSDMGAMVYAIADDLAARGLVAGLPEFVQPIDYPGFVELTAQFKATHSWY